MALRQRLTICLATAFIVILAVVPAGADLLLDAMSAELARTVQLGQGDFDPPYYVSFEVYERQKWSVAAQFGGIMNVSGSKARRGRVEVRIGDYSFDNTVKGGVLDGWLPDPEFDASHMDLRLPVDEDADAIRTQLWLVTDTMYKAAVADYLRKKGRKIYMVDEDGPLEDFSREKPVQYINEIQGWELDESKWEALAKKASSRFKNYPGLTAGRVAVSFSSITRRMVNTEGTKILDGGRYFTLQISAQGQAADGQKLDNFETFFCRSAELLPTEKEVIQAVDQVAKEIQLLAKAEKLAPYTGPAILDPSLAGVFFHEAVGHRLEGERMKDADEGGTFKGKIGKKVLPQFLSLLDDPTLDKFSDMDLFGHYLYDDQGVPSKEVYLIKNGVLRNFLMSRTPIKGFTKSNGHGRGDGTMDPMARMGNTIVKSGKIMSAGKLKEELIKLARKQKKPYALILKKARGGETSTNKYSFQAFKHSPVLIYKVDAKTGAETLVRGAEVVGTPLVSLNKVVAAGDDPEVFNGYCGAESGWVPVSVVAPSLLISEIEVQRTNEKPYRPPILPPPFSGK